MVIADENQTGNSGCPTRSPVNASTCQSSSAASVCTKDECHLLETTLDAHAPERLASAARAMCSAAGMMDCSQCGAQFETRQELFQHVKLAHQQHAHAKKRTFRCDQCLKSFRSMTALRNHARTHRSYFNPHSDSSSSSVLSFLRSASNISEDTFNATNTTCPETTFTIFDVSDVLPVPGADPDSTLQGASSHQAPFPNNSDETLCMNNDPVCTESRTKSKRRSAIPVRVVSRTDLTTPVDDVSHVTDKKPKCSTPIREKRRQSDSHRGETPHRNFKTHGDISNEVEIRTDTSENDVTLTSQNTPERQMKTPRKSAAMNTRTPTRKRATPTTKKYTPITKTINSVEPNKTPKNKMNTPTGRNRTPGSQKKRGKHEATPQNKKGVLSSTKKTSLSCPRTPTSSQYRCTKCGKSFVDKSRLEVHFAVHSKQTPEKCGIPRQALKRNILATQSNQESPSLKKFECDRCGRCYDNEKFLTSHKKLHVIETPFRCQICSKDFKYMTSLKAHAFVHRGEEKCQNDVTSATAARYVTRSSQSKLDSLDQDGALVSNVFSILTNDFPSKDTMDSLFPCKTCDYKTHSPAELLNHLKSHSRAGPYTCSTCSKSYKLQSNLRTHEKLHKVQRLKQILVSKCNSSLRSEAK